MLGDPAGILDQNDDDQGPVPKTIPADQESPCVSAPRPTHETGDTCARPNHETTGDTCAQSTAFDVMESASKLLHARLPEPRLSSLQGHKGMRGVLEDRRTTVAAVLDSVEHWTHSPDGQLDLSTAIMQYRDALFNRDDDPR